MHCIVCVCIALYANKPTTTPLHWTVCVCVHCVCIACALQATPICIGPRQGLVTAHDRYARQTGAGVHCTVRANVYRAEARTLPCALHKMRVNCVLCVRIVQNAFALRLVHLCITFYACALSFMRVHCTLCTCALR